MAKAKPESAPKPAALVFVGLLGLAGLVWMIWPKPPAVETLAASPAGSAWTVRADKAALSGPTMGTSFAVILAEAELEHSHLEALQAQIDAELQAVNDEMSTYLPDSTISSFNAAEAGVGVAVEAELLAMVELSRELSEASEGAFDITVGPLVDAWGFGPDPQTRTEPSSEQLAALRERVGLAKLNIQAEPPQLAKTVAGLRIDLSAIAKGHGCDRIAGLLDAEGLTNYMVEIGGEVRVRGHNPGGEPWKIGVEKPTATAGEGRVVQQLLRVSEVAVATSGDYRNYWEKEGVRYSHTLDARTGRPIEHRLASVTVVHPDSAAEADGWATALNVLGPEEGLAVAEAEGIAAYFLIRSGEGFEAKASSAFEPYMPD